MCMYDLRKNVPKMMNENKTQHARYDDIDDNFCCFSSASSNIPLKCRSRTGLVKTLAIGQLVKLVTAQE